MNIGFDVSVLNVAKAGVWNYHFHLLRALLKIVPAGDKLILIDDPATHGRQGVHEVVGDLLNERASIRGLSGLRHRRLSRMPALQDSFVLPLTQRVDGLLERPWEWAATTMRKRQFATRLDDVDVFHASDVLNLRIPGAAAVTTIHDLTSLLFPEYHTAENIALLAEKYRFAQEEAEIVIAISQSTREDIVKYLGIEPERVAVIAYGCDPRFHPLAADEVRHGLNKWGLAPGNFLLYVGTIEPRKNLVRLLEAYAEARGMFNAPRPQLVLAGAIGWKAAEFLQRMEALGLGDEVHLIGPVASVDLPVLYNGAMAMVYPSLYEGFGLPPLEAMASGTPVITSRVSSLPEVVGDAAVLIDPRDSGDLTQAIVNVASDARLRRHLRTSGLDRAKLFTWEKTALETLAVYRQAIARTLPRSGGALG